MSFIVIAQPTLLLHQESLLIWQKVATCSVTLGFSQGARDASFAQPPLQPVAFQLGQRNVDGNDVCYFHDSLTMVHVTDFRGYLLSCLDGCKWRKDAKVTA